MKDFIKQKLIENLKDYCKVSKNLITNENINIPSLSLTKNVDLNDSDKNKLINLKYDDIDFEQLSTTSPIKLKVILPWDNDLSEGIALDIQIVKDSLFQIHISLDKNLQNYGLGYKIYKALITQFGHLYSGKGRRHNKSQVPKIWNKLNSEPGISCYSNKNMDICILDDNPNKDELKKLVGF